LPEKPTNYQAFMLRCWTSAGDQTEGEAYRFSLEDPHTGERFSFGGLDALVAFLSAQLSGRRVTNSYSAKIGPGGALPDR
jgi:hypothetical protein